jgi:hypothetical protein
MASFRIEHLAFYQVREKAEHFIFPSLFNDYSNYLMAEIIDSNT